MEGQHRPISQTSAQLSDVLNPEEDQRDSAYYSQNGDHSKHTSTASSNPQSVFTQPPPSGYHNALLDNTPSPVATSAAVHPMISPTSSMSVASMVSPITSTSVDQSMLRKLDRPSEQSLPNNLNSGAGGESLSRRGSMDSRINHDFRDILRPASSPYGGGTPNQSLQPSINAAQRNPGHGPERLSSISRNSNSYQPNVARFGGAPPPRQVRMAPTITGPATGSIAHAAEPTKGQAWAFPDEPIHKTTSRSTLNTIDHTSINQTSFLDSRRSSLADSLASSSRCAHPSPVLHGQRQLEDGMPDYQGLSRASSEFQGASHHHHSLEKNKPVNKEDGSPGSSTTYSRTPECRINHKIAERKRRIELKQLFDKLKDLMQQDRGDKASKGDILLKAIQTYVKQKEHIEVLEKNCQIMGAELELSRREAISLREENARLRDELSMLTHGQQAGGGAPPQSLMSSQHASQYPPSYSQGPPPRTELPPLRNLGGLTGTPGRVPVQQQSSDVMTGIQYHSGIQYHHDSRTNAYPGGRF